MELDTTGVLAMTEAAGNVTSKTDHPTGGDESQVMWNNHYKLTKHNQMATDNYLQIKVYINVSSIQSCLLIPPTCQELYLP